jgi:putative DNA primase/helicase
MSPDAFDHLADVMEEAAERPPEFSDDALALEFSIHHDGKLLYVHAWLRWLRWDGCRWARDDTLRVFDLVRAVCRAAAARAEASVEGPAGMRLARAIASAKTIAAVERLARADLRHARRVGDFDADPWALNTPAGVVDLRTGEMRAHLPGDLHTKVTAVAPCGDCPQWLGFLKQITQGDEALIAYLQRSIGYTLTGIIREQEFTFVQGPGGNGKSVLLSTVATMLGDYVAVAMADIFTIGRYEQHPTGLAALCGARMVLVGETEAGHAWAEARIKALTGGDRMSARVMRGDPFEFDPMFKLWITGNHRPVLRNPGPAMRRRLRLVPLTYVPPKPDPDLPEALKTELPGILAWAIQGCLAWQRQGLTPPAVVVNACADYFAEQDSVATWFGERCDRLPAAQSPSRGLFADWQKWAKDRGEEPGTEVRFSEALEQIAAKKRTNRGVVFLGVALKPEWAGGAADNEGAYGGV